ncbi:hypothetical protein ACNTMW_04675 [Planosporangium sp. 12N6]|uniref:hypothetical protein n=1 Tax=Planosporangium spinosum TaxID=3402278 RepID=UPI003CE82240
MASRPKVCISGIRHSVRPRSIRSVERRPYPPGAHGRHDATPARRLRLVAKQRLRHQYDVRERQLRVRPYRPPGRQTVSHGHITVDGTRSTGPRTLIVLTGQAVEVRQASRWISLCRRGSCGAGSPPAPLTAAPLIAPAARAAVADPAPRPPPIVAALIVTVVRVAHETPGRG